VQSRANWAKTSSSGSPVGMRRNSAWYQATASAVIGPNWPSTVMRGPSAVNWPWPVHTR